MSAPIIAVTGTTGRFGSSAVQALHDIAPEASVRALTRAEADYEDTAALRSAFAGVDTLLLVSGRDRGRRVEQHRNAVEAARDAGVRRIIYTSIVSADREDFVVAEDHIRSEQWVRESGLDWIVLRNAWYTENFAAKIGEAKMTGGILFAAPVGRVASAAITDLAEAAARIALSEEHSGVVELSGARSWSYPELAEALTELLGKEIHTRVQTVPEYRSQLLSIGSSEQVAEAYSGLDANIEAGLLAETSPTLAGILGREPLSLVEALRPLSPAPI